MSPVYARVVASFRNLFEAEKSGYPSITMSLQGQHSVIQAVVVKGATMKKTILLRMAWECIGPHLFPGEHPIYVCPCLHQEPAANSRKQQ